MGKLTVIALQVEGDAAAIAAACETVRQELGRLVGPASLPAGDARASAPAPPLIDRSAAVIAASNGKVHKSKGGAQRATRQAGTPVPLSNDRTVAARVLRYLAESHSSGDPDCTVDEVFRISGSATTLAVRACLVKLKREGLVQAGSARGKWRISTQGLEFLKQRPQKPEPSANLEDGEDEQ